MKSKMVNEKVERVSSEILIAVNHIIGQARLQGRFNLRKKLDDDVEYDRFQKLEDESQAKIDSEIALINDLLQEFAN